MAITTMGITLPASASSSSSASIHATVVPEDRRMDFLPRVFKPRSMLIGEMTVYGWMSRLCPDYSGGLWDYVDLSNGGFYMRPSKDRPMTLHVEGNDFSGTVSADAAGIIASLFAINELLWNGAGHLDDAYYSLRDFANEHPEGAQILRAID